MKRFWSKPVLIPGAISPDDEHLELYVSASGREILVCRIAPEDQIHADNGRMSIEWLIGSRNVAEKKLRRQIEAGIGERVLEVDDPAPWTTFAYQSWRSECFMEQGEQRILWRMKNGLPLAPKRPDWIFERVPDDELIACCFWEYGRESHTFALTAAQYQVESRIGMAAASEQEPKDDQERARVEAWIEEVGFDSEEFLERYWNSDFAFIQIYDAIRRFGGSSAAPWQELPEDHRARLVEMLSESCIFRPLAPALVGDLEQIWIRNREGLLEIRANNPSPEDDSEWGELYSESKPVETSWDEDSQHPETVSAAFTIDFSRFADAEILNAFRTWLQENRPQRWKPPRRVFPTSPRRGRKLLDYRVALERLALMRLLNENYPEELRESYPEIWKKLCRSDTHFRRECRLACEFFRSLFPFLPDDELPRTSKPLEVWEPEILQRLGQDPTSDGVAPGDNS